MEMRRREFLAMSVAGIGGMLFGSRFAVAQEQKPKTYDPYELVPLGKTKIKLCRVGLGTGMRGGGRQSNHTRMGKEKFEELVHGAYERGVRLFDAADLYGTHPFLAGALAKMKRKDYVISSKIWWHQGGIPEKERPDSDIVVERFCKELNTDYIDIILLHCVSSAKWPEELSKQMEILEKLKKKGVVRAHGVSCHGLEALEAAANEPWVDSVHVRINAYAEKMDAPVDKVVPVIKKMHEAGKGVIGMKLIGEGTFRKSDEKRDGSIRFVLGLGYVNAMVVGFEKIEEIDDFAARVRKVPVESKPIQVNVCRDIQAA